MTETAVTDTFGDSPVRPDFGYVDVHMESLFCVGDVGTLRKKTLQPYKDKLQCFCDIVDCKTPVKGERSLFEKSSAKTFGMGLTGYSDCNSVCHYISKLQNTRNSGASSRGPLPRSPQNVFECLISFFQSFAID